MASIMKGFGCRVIAFDPFPNADLQNNGITYLPLSELYSQSDIISLHVPLTNETKHLLNEQSLAKMKKGVMIINTGRGALIDTKALIDALKTSQIGAAGLDVYEEEENIFFQDLSDQVLQDDVLARLMTFPNVMITSHQAFLTQEALANIAETTLKNVSDFEQGLPLSFEVKI
jgi:D-lactate dehydrogenase